MKVKNTISKYIFLIIPLILLAVNALFLKSIDIGDITVSDNSSAFHIILIILMINPSVCLILETIGLVKAVRGYRRLNEDMPYSEKRKGIHCICLYGGAMLFTALWFGSMLFIICQYTGTL